MSVLVFLLVFCLVGSVSASEINETQTLSLASDDNGLSVAEDNNVLSANGNDSELLSAGSGNLLGESNGNSNDLLGADAGTFADLQTKIDNTLSWSTIVLDRDYVGSGTYINVNRPLTIEGNGHTLDAKGLSCVMWVTYNGVTLKNLNIVNGKQPSGGGIYINKENCVIDNCTFINDISTGYGGGAIATDGNNLKVTNSKFYSCKCTSTTSGYGGGAIMFREKAVGTGNVNNLNAGYISNCYFEDCSAGRDAGAIKAFCSNVIVNSSIFYKCSGPWGGAVFLMNSANGKILNSSFINCSSTTQGGSLFIKDSVNVVVDACKFINSKVTYSNGADDKFVGGHGGSIYIQNGATGVTVSNCDFNNSFATNYGGAIFTKSDKSHFINCSAYNCYSFRGGVFMISSDDCEIVNCTGSDNTCGHGTVIYGLDIDNRDSDGKVYRLLVDSSSFYNNYASVSESSAYIVGQNCVIQNCVLVNNTSTAYTLKFAQGKNNVVKNSIIFNNSDSRLIASGDSATVIADNNWFGNTENNYVDRPVTAGSGVTLNKWYFLTLAANQTVVAQNQTVLMDIGLNGLYDSKTGKVSKGVDYNLPFDMVPERFLPAEFGIGTDNGVTNQSGIVFSHETHSFLYTPEHIDSGSVFLDNVQGMHLSDSVIVIKNGTFTDLYNRINYTDENGILNLPYNFTYDEEYDNNWLNRLYGLSDVSGGLPLDKNLTINGNDYTIDAQNKVDIFDVQDELVLEDVKLKDGTINNNGDLTLKDVEHTGSTYSVVNNGNLFLEKEYTLETIKNNGLITGPFTITVMDNKTVVLPIGGSVTDINATTDFGVNIEGGKLLFINQNRIKNTQYN